MKPIESQHGIVTSVSRRTLFWNAAITAGGLALLLGTALSAVAKMAQAGAGYHDEPKGDKSCSNCSLFNAPDSCYLVEGTIDPQGWCKFHHDES
jgi:hypothetical protein